MAKKESGDKFKLIPENKYNAYLIGKYFPIEFHTRKSARLHAKKFAGVNWVLLQYSTVERFTT